MNNNRKPAGNPDGGRWTEKDHSDSNLELDDNLLDHLEDNEHKSADDRLREAPAKTLELGEVTIHKDFFPYEIQCFDSYEDAKLAGFTDDQIWAVSEGDGDEDEEENEWEVTNPLVYGPPHNYTNAIFFAATEERHDFKTYWEEEFVGSGGGLRKDTQEGIYTHWDGVFPDDPDDGY